MMRDFGEYLKQAVKEGWATGHFNASELDQVRAIVEACKEAGAPAIIGTSEGERKHLGVLEAVAIRDVLKKEYGIPIFLNADHCKSVASAKEAIDAGYDSVHIDLSSESFEENVKGTREVVEYARQNKFKIQNLSLRQIHGLRPSKAKTLAFDSKFKISVEGELGYLRGESKIQKEKIKVSPEDYTKVEEAVEFVKKTGVDRLAIVVGNIHGISLDEPDLEIKRIREIRRAVPESVALVLHAGSGIPEDQIKAAIKAGIVNIHINTELRVAFVKELKKSLAEHLDEVAMYKLDQEAILAMKKVVKDKLALFGSLNKI